MEVPAEGSGCQGFCCCSLIACFRLHGNVVVGGVGGSGGGGGVCMIVFLVFVCLFL